MHQEYTTTRVLSNAAYYEEEQTKSELFLLINFLPMRDSLSLCHKTTTVESLYGLFDNLERARWARY